MKHSIKGILPVVILAITTTSTLVAQSGNSWAEQWYRAKFGRPSPTEQARLDAIKQPSLAPVSAVAVTRPRYVNATLEQLYQTKHGRPTPREEARIREANLGKDAVMITRTESPADSRFENWYRARYGRPSPNSTAH